MNLFPRKLARVFSSSASILLSAAVTASAAVVTVNDAGDTTNACATTGSGTCTLRDALAYANAHGGSTIAFDIAESGVHTITPQSAYPTISAPVTIDGFTQPGSSPNTNGPGLPDNSIHLIEVSGATILTDGTDLTGTRALPNVEGPGILLNNATGVTIGGSAAGAGNVISANGSAGIEADNGSNHVIHLQ